MLMQLIVILSLGVLLCIGVLSFLVFHAMRNMKDVANNALLAGRAASARDLAEAQQYSADAALSREITKSATGPAIATTIPQEDTYTTPDGKQLKVLRPFL